MRFYFVRHGQTVHNLEKKWQGWNDSPLTKTGIDQARDCGIKLENISFTAVVSSPLGRALHSREIILSCLKSAPALPREVDDRLKERNVGILSGVPFSEMEARFPEELKIRRETPLKWTPPQGESSPQMIERVRAFIQDLDLGIWGDTVLAVTHGGVCSQLFCMLQGIAPEEAWGYRIPNTSLSCFEKKGANWVALFSDIEKENSPQII